MSVIKLTPDGTENFDTRIKSVEDSMVALQKDYNYGKADYEPYNARLATAEINSTNAVNTANNATDTANSAMGKVTTNEKKINNLFNAPSGKDLELQDLRYDSVNNVQYNSASERVNKITSELNDKAKQTDLNTTNANVTNNTNSINSLNSQVSVHTNQIQSLASGSPKGVYTTLPALQTAFPTGNSNTYVVTADGCWYYWNGSTWAKGGTYQSTGIGNNSVKRENLESLVQNLINTEYTNVSLSWTNDSFWHYITGQLVALAAYAYTSISVVAGERYKISGTEKANANLYMIKDINGNILSVYPNVNNANATTYTDVTFEIPSGGVLLCINSVYSYGYTVLQKIINFHLNIEDNAVKREKLESGMQPLFIKNTYDNVALTWTDGSFYRETTAAIVTDANYSRTYIDVVPGEKYKISGASRGNESLFLVVNSANSKLVQYPDPALGAVTVVYTDIEVTIPPNGSKLLINTLIGSGYSTVKKLSDKYNIDNSKIVSILDGKTVYGFGDSIAYGHLAAISYLDYIKQNNNMKLTKYAGNGATITGSSTTANCILKQITDASATIPDYVLFEGLANDAYITVTSDPLKLGSISTGFTATLDTTTFCGSFESICKTLMTKYMGSQIIFIAVHKLIARDFGAQDTLQNLAKQICAKWGIPVVDLYNSGGLNSFIPSMQSAYSYDSLDGNGGNTSIGGSGTHPNEAGYKKYYVPAITAKMKSLI